MNKILLAICFGLFTTVTFAAEEEVSKAAVVPAKLNKADISGKIFERPGMSEIKHEDGHATLDVTSLLSSDKKFASGMFRSSKVRSEIYN